MTRYHADTDFLIRALSQRGPEWELLDEVLGEDATLEISAVAWYEFCRGPRTAEQLAVAEDLFGEDGIVPLTKRLAERAAEVFRSAKRARRRAADIAIGVTAVERGAVLLTSNAQDFAGIEGLDLRHQRRST